MCVTSEGYGPNLPRRIKVAEQAPDYHMTAPFRMQEMKLKMLYQSTLSFHNDHKNIEIKRNIN